MKRFLCRVAAWALLPAAVLLALAGAVFYRSGEYLSPQSLVDRTLAGEDLAVELYYSGADFTAWYKGNVAFERGAGVLALGTSRVLQFRSCMLPRADFYNAGSTNSHITTMVDFLAHFPEDKLPDTIILGLDHFFFSGSWMLDDQMLPWDYTWYRKDPLPLTGILSQYGAGKFGLRAVFGADKRYIGLPATAQHRGFLSDGSYDYGFLAEDEQFDPTFRDALTRIERSAARFEPSAAVSEAAIDRLVELLDWCRDRDITVIGFLPPYPGPVYEAMLASGKYGYLDQLYPRLQQVFAGYPGCEVFDFSYMPEAPDEEFVDSLHGGDVVYARILLSMAEQGVLTEYTDAETLRRLIDTAQSSRVILPR